MGPKKGMSADEKKNTLLKIYHNLREPMNLKELEKLGSKKGIVEKTIKDINQSLVDDNLVSTDKIGSSNFYWSFPGAEYKAWIHFRDEQAAAVESTRKRIATDKARIEAANADRGESEIPGGRAAALTRCEALEARRDALKAELAAAKENDPAEYDRVRKQTGEMREHANRWTENLWSTKDFMTKKCGMEPKQVDGMMKEIGIAKDLDLLDPDDEED